MNFKEFATRKSQKNISQKTVGFDIGFNTIQATNFSSMFEDCTSLKAIEIQSSYKGLTDISDKFALKAFQSTLPEEITSKAFMEITNKVIRDKKNKKISKSNQKFLITHSFLKRYGYETIVNKEIIPKDTLQAYFLKNPLISEYENIIELDQDSKTRYIKDCMRYTYNTKRFIIPFSISMAMLKKFENQDIEYIINNTRANLLSLLTQVKEISKEEILTKYTSENIKNGTFLKELGNILSEYIYYENSSKYTHLPADIRMQIEKDYFQYYIKSLTINDNNSKSEAKKEAQINQKYKKIYNDIAKAFDIGISEN